MALSGSTTEQKIWNFLKGKGLNDYGTAGLMGNLYAESGLQPMNLQNSYEKKLGFTDESYTKAVDDGSYGNFIKDSAGYGLAQWTYWSRKENLLQFALSRNASIGGLEMQLEFLYKELSESYKVVLNALKSAVSVLAASNVVLTQFEKPADQSSSVQQKRAGYGQTYYDKYASKEAETTGGSNMAVKIGHASIDENGKASGGTAGDQTGKEVCTREWYNKPWICVIRPKDSTVAEKIAKAMEQACANDKIGYDQNQRTTLYTQAKACGWDLSKITTACECDCSSLVAVCVNAAGITVSKDIYTGNEKSALVATGKFDTYTSSDYIGSSAKLKRGDILLASGHTAVVLSNGASAGSTSSGTTSGSGNTSYSGKGIGTAVAKATMNIRSGAGTSYKSYGTISKGTAVEVLEVLSSGWYKIVWPGASCGYAYTSNANGAYYTYTANKTSSSTSSKKVDAAQSYDKSLAGTYTTTEALNMRTGAGTGKTIILTIPKGSKVQNYGYYTKDSSGTKWLYLTYNGQTGFCSSKYLKK